MPKKYLKKINKNDGDNYYRFFIYLHVHILQQIKIKKL